MNAETFLPRDAEKAIAEIKEMLYARLADQQLVLNAPSSHSNWDNGFDDATESEICFLRRMLDMMERS